MDNLLPLQVNNDLEGIGQRMPVFTEEQRARLQKSRAERTERKGQNLRTSWRALVEHASAMEHALSNERKQKERQDLQDG
jgi:ribosome recycling factor